MKRKYPKQPNVYNKKEATKINKSKYYKHYVNVTSKKTSSKTTSEIIQSTPLENNPLPNNGSFGLLYKDAVVMICIALLKEKPTEINSINTRNHFGKKTTCRSISPILSFVGMCTLNKWFYKNLSEQKKYIY